MNSKVLIPLIRKVMPGLVANQITSVQPMQLTGNEFFTMTTDYYFKLNEKYWPYQHHLRTPNNSLNPVIAAERWCYDNLKGRNWRSHGTFFAFKRKSDYTMFLLKWA
jgi:hypothetical protein